MHLVIGVTFKTQTVVGILGNLFLLHHYLVLQCTKGQIRAIDWFMKHLTVANLLVLSKGVPETMAAFGWKYFLGDTGCKLILFVYRVGRGVSMGSICSLGVFRVITIRARMPRWAKLKALALKYMGLILSLWWILSMLVNVIFPLTVVATSTNYSSDIKIFRYFSAARHSESGDILYAVLLTFPDMLCLGLMLWANGSIVFILYQHKQRVQHLHMKISPRPSPESTATHTILLLVSTFTCFYAVSTSLHAALSIVQNPSWVLVNLSAFLGACFPAVSPFVLVCSGAGGLRFCST